MLGGRQEHVGVTLCFVSIAKGKNISRGRKREGQGLEVGSERMFERADRWTMNVLAGEMERDY